MLLGYSTYGLVVFFFNDTATTEIYTLPYTTLFRSVPELLDVMIGERSHRRVAAAEMQRAGAGDRDFRQRLRARAEVREVRAVDRAFPRDAAPDRGDRLRAARAGGARRRLERHVAEPRIEIAVIGGAAELAVGREPQSDALLQPHGVLARAVFRRGQRRRVVLAAREAAALLEQRRRPQQAAD